MRYVKSPYPRAILRYSHLAFASCFTPFEFRAQMSSAYSRGDQFPLKRIVPWIRMPPPRDNSGVRASRGMTMLRRASQSAGLALTVDVAVLELLRARVVRGAIELTELRGWFAAHLAPIPRKPWPPAPPCEPRFPPPPWRSIRNAKVTWSSGDSKNKKRTFCGGGHGGLLINRLCHSNSLVHFQKGVEDHSGHSFRSRGSLGLG